MAIQVNPITQSLPATTAIQDPAVRRFAQAVDDALRALRSEEGAVESLKKAADAMNGAIAGGTPPSIAQWLFSSELYQKLTTEIARVDTQAKQEVLDEALARSQAIQEIRAALAEIESTPAYDPATTYQIGDLVTYDDKLYRAKSETTGNLPTNTVYWDKVGDYATIGDVVAAHTLQLSEIESDITNIGGDLAAEITARDTLATQLRGTYPGADVAMVSQGLLYSERQARVTADGVTVSNLNALRAQVGVTEAGALTEGFILDEQTIRNTNDLAIVSAVNTALAQITGVSTSISQSGQNLIANWTQAQATKWSQIEAEVLTSGGQTIRAALLQESQVRANADGSLGAQWTIKTDINGYISGIGFASTANNAAPTSEFIINADRFVMTMPGYGEHVPFAIGPSGAEFTGLTSWGNVQGKTGFASISQITTSNVTTYIANAAIGNAQFGGHLWSMDWNYAGGSGWFLNRNGNFYCNNIYARGDIEASSLKAGVAMVDALSIKGGALIIPLYIYAGAATWDEPGTLNEWQYRWMWQTSITLGTNGTLKIEFGNIFNISLYSGHDSFGTGTITKRVQIFLDGSPVETVAQSASGQTLAVTIGMRWYTLSAGTHTIQVRGESRVGSGATRFNRTAAATEIHSYEYSTSAV